VSSTTSPFRSLPPGGQTDLECVTDSVCYSPGASTGGLYRTIDGGQSWQATAPIPLNEEAGGRFTFSCANADTCAVIGSPQGGGTGQLAEFAITTDAGAHWTTAPVSSPSGISNAGPGRFVCATSTYCVLSVSGTPTEPDATSANPTDRVGTFLTTANGGQSWIQATTVPSTPAASVWTINCTSDGSCLAVSALGESPHWIVALSSHDWGMTWTAGPPAVYNHAPILYASCGDATHCMLVPLAGPSGAPYEIATTSDAGRTWQVSGPLAGWLNMPTGVSCASGTSCWIAMSHYDGRNPAGAYSDPVIEVTHDGGVTWSTIPLPTNKPPISDVLTLSCPPSGDGCMGIGNLQDHFVLPRGRPTALSGPLVISNLPPTIQ
jgi:photosystem II stability/assembly factor-like uncharacterized protein